MLHRQLSIGKCNGVCSQPWWQSRGGLTNVQFSPFLKILWAHFFHQQFTRVILNTAVPYLRSSGLWNNNKSVLSQAAYLLNEHIYNSIHGLKISAKPLEPKSFCPFTVFLWLITPVMVTPSLPKVKNGWNRGWVKSYVQVLVRTARIHWVGRHTPIIAAFGKLRQKDCHELMQALATMQVSDLPGLYSIAMS